MNAISRWWRKTCGWLYSVADAMGIVRLVRIAHYVLPVVCFGLLSPFFEIWASAPWLWVLWGALIAGWALCGMTLHGERLALGISSLEHAKDTVGLLWALVREVGRRRKREIRPAEFRTHVRHVQERLLRHLVAALADDLRVPESELHANWMVLEARELVTQVRDRPVERRPATRRLSLDTDLRGAAAAAAQAQIYIENDTLDSSVYGEKLPYRSFISVPIQAGEEVIGVLNVDSISPSTFSDDLEWRIKEVGYIIGLLEVERWEE